MIAVKMKIKMRIKMKIKQIMCDGCRRRMFQQNRRIYLVTSKRNEGDQRKERVI